MIKKRKKEKKNDVRPHRFAKRGRIRALNCLDKPFECHLVLSLRAKWFLFFEVVIKFFWITCFSFFFFFCTRVHTVLRQKGQKGEKTCFIFSVQHVLSSVQWWQKVVLIGEAQSNASSQSGSQFPVGQGFSSTSYPLTPSKHLLAKAHPHPKSTKITVISL